MPVEVLVELIRATEPLIAIVVLLAYVFFSGGKVVGLLVSLGSLLIITTVIVVEMLWGNSIQQLLVFFL